MKKSLTLLTIVISMTSIKAQVKLYNTELPYFDKTKLVKTDKSVKTVNQFTKRVTKISEFNSIGKLHGVTIQYRNDGTVNNIEYYHNNALVYKAVPFVNGSTIQKVFNYNNNGSFNGLQYSIYDNDNATELSKVTFEYDNGRLVSIDNTFKFPKYTTNFVNGKLDGEFYFYDDMHCQCYYAGTASNGKINGIMQVTVGKTLSYKMDFYTFKDDTLIFVSKTDYSNVRNEKFNIKQIPVIVENKNVLLNNNNAKIVFNKQIDWMYVLKEKSLNPNYNADIEEIDLSDAMYGAPEPISIPSVQH